MNMHLILSVVGGTHAPVAEHLSSARHPGSAFPAWLGWVLPVAAPVSLAGLLFCALCWERWLFARSDADLGAEEDHSQSDLWFTAEPVGARLDGSHEPDRHGREAVSMVARR